MNISNKVIRLGHTDAAGRVYTAKYFELAHEAIEENLEKAGFPLSDFLNGTLPPMPIVHAEADFKSPLHLCDNVYLSVTWSLKGDSSVNSTTVFKDQDGALVAEVSMVHVCIDASSGKPCALPDVLKTAFSN